MPTAPDRILRAALTGTASHCVDLMLPLDEAIAAIREVSDRPDLLADVAGQLAGATDPAWFDWSRRRAQARLLVAAGADRSLLRAAVERGRARLREPIAADGEVPVDVDDVVAEIIWPQDPAA
jgi:hypothetical protein